MEKPAGCQIQTRRDKRPGRPSVGPKSRRTNFFTRLPVREDSGRCQIQETYFEKSRLHSSGIRPETLSPMRRYLVKMVFSLAE